MTKKKYICKTHKTEMYNDRYGDYYCFLCTETVYKVAGDEK
jgi:hypothetical protein